MRLFVVPMEFLCVCPFAPENQGNSIDDTYMLDYRVLSGQTELLKAPLSALTEKIVGRVVRNAAEKMLPNLDAAEQTNRASTKVPRNVLQWLLSWLVSSQQQTTVSG